MTRWEGSRRAIWRQSSLPIEPPPPVTRILRPVSSSRIVGQSGCTGWRFRRSSMVMARSSLGAARPETRSAMRGMVRIGRCERSQSSTILRIWPEFADGMAMMTTSAPTRAATSGVFSQWPKTRIPCTSRPFLSGSSSMKPTGRYSLDGSWSRERASVSPARPAPTMRAFFEVARRGRRSLNQRQASRGPPRKTTSSPAKRGNDARGMYVMRVMRNTATAHSDTPTTTAWRIRTRSGTDANRQTPRYSPKYRKFAPWTTKTTGRT